MKDNSVIAMGVTGFFVLILTLAYFEHREQQAQIAAGNCEALIDSAWQWRPCKELTAPGVETR